MTFLESARNIIEQVVSDIRNHLEGYVPRVLVSDGTNEDIRPFLRYFRKELNQESSQVFDEVQVINCPKAAIIGDAGSGKSKILNRAYLEAAQIFLDDNNAPIPFLINLQNQLPSSGSIKDSLEHWYDGLFEQIALQHKPGSILFIDSLDEILVQPGMANFTVDLSMFLKEHKEILKYVILACRRSFWN